MMKTHHLKPNVEGVVVEVNPLERLTQFWEQMDSIGLQNVIVENLKKVSSFWKGQLSVALGSVHNSPFLVCSFIIASSTNRNHQAIKIHQ